MVVVVVGMVVGVKHVFHQQVRVAVSVWWVVVGGGGVRDGSGSQHVFQQQVRVAVSVWVVMVVVL